MKATLSSACILILVLGLSLCFAAPGQTEAALAAPYTDVSGEINADTTWSLAGSPYVVTGDVTVMPGITLTIEPGVQVRFNGNYALGVRGTLIAEGLAGQEILFTSNLGSPAAGDWGVLDFRSDSRYSHVQHAIIEYGGNAYKPGAYCATGAVCVNTSSFVMEDSSVRHSPTRGVSLAQSNATIYQNSFDGNALEAIRLHACDLAVGECHPRIIGNSFTNNKYAMLLDNAQLPEMSGNSASGNEVNGFVLSPLCNLKGNNTFYADDLPYVVPAAGSWCHIGPYGIPTHLTIQPGTIFKLQNSIKFQYDSTITATGTAEKPIIFTSIKDDSVGGDTNNDGNASSPAAEDWGAVVHEGPNVQASYEHVIWRYGGNTAFGWGPLVAVQSGAKVTIRDSELTNAEVGTYTYDTASLDFQNNQVHDLATSGVDTYSTGAVLVAGNRFTNITYFGMTVQKGAPVVRDNYFEGNASGVKVICSSDLCSPVVSPHNRFIGSDQIGVDVNYPQSVCVDARRNGWGDASGPADASTATDACGMADNPGTGAAVSDGVNYSPWEGGMGRPVIGYPRCGVTARDQPTFSGRAAEGATVSFYDNGVLIGQTIAAADDSFTWTPPVPLLDGEHSLTAIADLNGQTSLPTPALNVEVDSSLPFDPMGVRIHYDFHGTTYTQTLRDAQGCSSLDTSLEMPVWVRPGTLMTVSVPVRSATMAGEPERTPDWLAAKPAPSSGKQIASAFDASMNAPLRDVPVQNDSSESIVGYRVASPNGYPDNRIYSGYGPVIDIPGGIPGGMPGTIQVEGDADVMLVTSDGALYRVDGNIGDPDFGSINVPSNSYPAEVTLHNRTGSTLFPVYFGKPMVTGSDYYGGSNVTEGVESGNDEPIILPANTITDTNYYALATGYDNGNPIYYPVKIHLPSGRDTEVTIEGSYGEVDVSNGFPGDICDFGLVPYEEQPGGTEHKPLNLLQFLDPSNPEPKISIGGSLSRIRVGTGKYYWQAYYCDGSPAGHGVVDISEVHRGDMALKFTLECQGKVKIGPYEYPLQKKPQNLLYRSDASFDEYEAIFPMSPGPMSFQICDGGYLCSQPLGEVLIDPDGYVYNADLGIDSKVTGATVTCEVYDEDYQAWSEWPAAFYESQINPQTTASDGYYAFFVPPGLYRVTAGAPGYATHTSPDIQVVSEIVHYNIPLAPTGEPPPGALYLPLIIH